MYTAKQQARDWRKFSVRWKRHGQRNVRVGRFTWRSTAYCHELGTAHDMALTLFPDHSGGFKTCRTCGYSHGVGEY